MQFRTLSSLLLLVLPLLTAAAPGRYDSTYQLRARDAEYYAERALEAREALLEATIENEVQKRVDSVLEERDAAAMPEPEPEPEPEADGGNKARSVESDEVLQKREESNRLWRRRGGTWGRRITRDL